MPLMPSCSPTSVLDTVRRVGMNDASGSELSATATLGALGRPSGGDSGTAGSMEVAADATGSVVRLLPVMESESPGPTCDIEGPPGALPLSGLGTADWGREGGCGCTADVQEGVGRRSG